MNKNAFTRTLGACARIAALALPLAAAGTPDPAKPAVSDGDFVTVRDRRFERHGQPYRFIGANFYQMAAMADPSQPGGRERLVRELDRLRAIGVTNLRLMGGSEGLNRMQPRAGEWNEGLFQGLDFALAEMAKRDMTGVIYLTNFWEWSGGMAEYVSWVTGEPIPDARQRGVKDPGAARLSFASRFYGLPRAQVLFREHITRVLNRRNTVNGRLYHADPTVMSWQLSNEPRPGPGGPDTVANLPAFYGWMDETARFIKERAPRQLVSTGSEGMIGCIGNADAFLKAHQSPAVDYVTLHLWVKNWGWLKEPHLGPQYEEASARALRHIEQHIALAKQLGKPLVMEEFGIDRDEWGLAPDSPTTMRDDYYGRIFHRVLTACQAGEVLQGANFWVWSGELGGRKSVGDNDVLTTDLTTLVLIRQYNAKMANIHP